MKVIAKCHNYTGCVLAYRGENIEIDQGAALVCPECGKPVVLTTSGGSWMKTTLILSLAIVIIGGAAAYFGSSWLKKKTPGGPSTMQPGTPETNPPETKPPEIKPPEIKPPVPQAEPPKTVVAPPKINLDVDGTENKSVKMEVLNRIYAMPNLTDENRTKLTLSVERARKMGKVVTVPFNRGNSSISAADAEALKAVLEMPEVIKLRDDPTYVFVILGYADARGDDKKNLAISQTRADSVLALMKPKFKLNVMHAVAMGSSSLLDADNLEKNRIVEVWAVLP